MSLIRETKKEISLGQIPSRIALYEELIGQAEGIFNLRDSGKRLEDVNKEHAQNLMFYDIMLQECKAIEDTIKLHMEEVESEIYKKYNENFSRALGPRDIAQYMKGEP